MLFGKVWDVAGRIKKMVIKTRFILMEKKSGGNWSGLYRQVVSETKWSLRQVRLYMVMSQNVM